MNTAHKASLYNRMHNMDILRYGVLVLVIVGVISTYVESQLTPCPDGWTAFKGSCYYFTHGTPASFVESEHFCQQHDAHLVHVNDALENAFLKDYLSRLVADNHWMGLTDELIEGVFMWTDTNTEPEFTDWNTGQPDESMHVEDCALFLTGYGNHWNDARCNATIQAICEMEMSGVSTDQIVG